jgi:hypothetical protein
MSYVSSPLVASALAALEREAQDNADAARLLATIEEVRGPVVTGAGWRSSTISTARVRSGRGRCS